MVDLDRLALADICLASCSNHRLDPKRGRRTDYKDEEDSDAALSKYSVIRAESHRLVHITRQDDTGGFGSGGISPFRETFSRPMKTPAGCKSRSPARVSRSARAGSRMGCGL